MIFDVWRRLSGAAGLFMSHARANQRLLATRPALFDIPGLDHPAAFRDLLKDSIDQCRSLINLLSLTQHSVESLQLIDQISDECCRILDASELIRHVHPQEIWRKESQIAHERMSSFMVELNSHPKIYTCLDGIRKSIFEYLNPEQKQMTSTFLLDMKHSGIALSSDVQTRLSSLVSELAKLETQFHLNILNPSFVHPVAVHRRHLPSFLQNALPRMDGQYVHLSPSNSEILLSHCVDAPTRRLIYMQINTQAKDNLTVLDSLIKCRREYSSMLGYPSYADMKLSGMLIQKSSHVINFLREISGRLRSKAAAEIKLLQSASNSSRNPSIDAWDIPFCSTQIRRQMGLGFTQIPTIPLERLLSGFNTIVKNLFGLQIKQCPLNKIESDCFKNELMKLLFLDCNSNHVGTLYLDLYARPDKFSAPAQFTIQNPSPGIIPCAAIICSFDPNKQHLCHSECVTLFHEFGHALHLFLSDSNYSCLAGTRGPSDFVEIASHLLERFLWDYRILSVISGKSAGAVRSYLEKLQRSKNLFSALDTQNQVAYSLMDQRLFGHLDTVPQDSARLWSEIQSNHTSFQFVEGTHPYTTFSHFCGYGATYYSYLYARLMAFHIWKEFFQQNPLSANAGRRFRDRFLAPGLGGNPMDILNNLLDTAPQPSLDAFIRQECE